MRRETGCCETGLQTIRFECGLQGSRRKRRRTAAPFRKRKIPKNVNPKLSLRRQLDKEIIVFVNGHGVPLHSRTSQKMCRFWEISKLVSNEDLFDEDMPTILIKATVQQIKEISVELLMAFFNVRVNDLIY